MKYTLGESYSRGDRKRPYLFLVAGFFLLLLILGVIFFFSRNRNLLVSPIPREATFQVIFMTPTPIETTPTSSPSATPKVKKTVSPTPKPTAVISPTVKPPSKTPIPN